MAKRRRRGRSAEVSTKLDPRPSKESGDQGGRPQLVINWKEVETLCAAQCTQKEIAAFLSISVDTLARAFKKEHGCGFADYFAQKRERGITSLRAKQYGMAINGDRTMLIWLGKQYMSQRDKQDLAIDKNPLKLLLQEMRSESARIGPPEGNEDNTAV